MSSQPQRKPTTQLLVVSKMALTKILEERRREEKRKEEQKTEQPPETDQWVDMTEEKAGKKEEERDDGKSSLEKLGLSGNQQESEMVRSAKSSPILPHLLHLTAEELAAAPGIDAEECPEISIIENLSQSSHVSSVSSPRSHQKSEELHMAPVFPEQAMMSDSYSGSVNSDQYYEQPGCSWNVDQTAADSMRSSQDSDLSTPKAKTKAADGNVTRYFPLNCRKPDFSKVKPKVRFPKGDYKPPASKCSPMMKSQSPDYRGMFKSPADIVKEVLLQTPDTPAAQTHLTSSALVSASSAAAPQDARRHQHATSLFKQLQEEHDRLLIKCAEAENTIDRMRLRAKVDLYSEPPKPSQAVQSGLSHNASKFMTLDFAQAQRAELNPPSSHQNVYLGQQLTDGLRSQADRFSQQLQTFEDRLKRKLLKPFEQITGLSQLSEGLSSLEKSYMLARNEHKLLQHRGEDVGHFDQKRELAELIYQCELHLDELKEQLDQTQQEQPTCEAPPSPPAPPSPSSVHLSEGAEHLLYPQNQPVPLPVDPDMAAEVELSPASDESGVEEAEMDDEKSLSSLNITPLNIADGCVEEDFAALMDRYLRFKELPKMWGSLGERSLLVQPEDEETERQAQKTGDLDIQKCLPQRKTVSEHRNIPAAAPSHLHHWTSQSVQADPVSTPFSTSSPLHRFTVTSRESDLSLRSRERRETFLSSTQPCVSQTEQSRAEGETSQQRRDSYGQIDLQRCLKDEEPPILTSAAHSAQDAQHYTTSLTGPEETCWHESRRFVYDLEEDEGSACVDRKTSLHDLIFSGSGLKTHTPQTSLPQMSKCTETYPEPSPSCSHTNPLHSKRTPPRQVSSKADESDSRSHQGSFSCLERLPRHPERSEGPVGGNSRQASSSFHCPHSPVFGSLDSSSGMDIHKCLPQRNIVSGRQTTPPGSSIWRRNWPSPPSHAAPSQSSSLPCHPPSSHQRLEMRKFHSSSLDEIPASEKRKPQTESRRELSQDGIASPETDSGFFGSESSRQTPAAAPSPLHQGTSQSVLVPQDKISGKLQADPVSTPFSTSSPSRRFTVTSRESDLSHRSRERRETFLSSPRPCVSQTEQSGAEGETSQQRRDSHGQSDLYTGSIYSPHTFHQSSATASPHHRGDSFRGQGFREMENHRKTLQTLQVKMTRLREDLQRCLKNGDALILMSAAPSAQGAQDSTPTPPIGPEETCWHESRRFVYDLEEDEGSPCVDRKTSLHDLIFTGSGLKTHTPQTSLPQMSKYTQTHPEPSASCSHTNPPRSKRTPPSQHPAGSIQASKREDEPDNRGHQGPFPCLERLPHHSEQSEGPVVGNSRQSCHRPHSPAPGCLDSRRSMKSDCHLHKDSPTHPSCQSVEWSDRVQQRHLAAASPPPQCMLVGPPLLMYPLPIHVSPSNSTGISSGVRGQREGRGRMTRSLSADKLSSMDSSLSRAIQAARHMKHTSRRMACSLATGLQHQDWLNQSCS